MKNLKWNYFQLLDSFLGEVIFRISKNHQLLPTQIMTRFYNHDWDIILLARRYGEEIKLEQKQAREAKKKAKQAKHNRRRMRR